MWEMRFFLDPADHIGHRSTWFKRGSSHKLNSQDWKPIPYFYHQLQGQEGD